MTKWFVDSFFYLTEDGIFDSAGICPDWKTLLLMQEKLTEIFQEYTEESLTQAIETAIVEQQQERKRRRIINKASRQPKPSKQGYVYIMLDSHLDCYKIGFSVKPSYREQTLQAQKPAIVLLHAWPATLHDEQRLHEKYKNKRVRGEWFNLDPNDIQEIKQVFESEVQGVS